MKVASRRFPRVCPFRPRRCDLMHRCLGGANLLLKGLSACAFAVAFLTPALPAQNPTGPPRPGWPTSSTLPDHGHAPVDAVAVLQPMDTPRPEHSCSLWAIAGTQGATVSAAMLRVPGKARGEYRKACGDLNGKKLAGAEQHLRKAVQEYPRYADAWVLLGQVLEARSPDGGSARCLLSRLNIDFKLWPRLPLPGRHCCATGAMEAKPRSGWSRTRA